MQEPANLSQSEQQLHKSYDFAYPACRDEDGGSKPSLAREIPGKEKKKR